MMKGQISQKTFPFLYPFCYLSLSHDGGSYHTETSPEQINGLVSINSKQRRYTNLLVSNLNKINEPNRFYKKLRLPSPNSSAS